jgi:PPOX class probable F420-dependent enzyme
VSRATVLDDAARRFVSEARTATMATMAPDGRPRLLPICFVLASGDDARGRPLLYTPLDEKPKTVDDPRRLARVRDLLVHPEVTLLVEHWSEDWDELAWLRLYGAGELLEPEAREREEHARAVAALESKYPQYASQSLSGRPVIRIALERAVGWGRIAESR